MSEDAYLFVSIAGRMVQMSREDAALIKEAVEAETRRCAAFIKDRMSVQYHWLAVELLESAAWSRRRKERKMNLCDELERRRQQTIRERERLDGQASALYEALTMAQKMRGQCDSPAPAPVEVPMRLDNRHTREASIDAWTWEMTLAGQPVEPVLRSPADTYAVRENARGAAEYWLSALSAHLGVPLKAVWGKDAETEDD